MGCFCFPSPKTALLVTREPIETQNLSLLRQKVTLMENAITMLKSDQDTLMALLKKRQKKQQNQEELLQNHKQKQEKNYLQLSAITRTLEVKMDQEIKAIWAVLRGLEESVEANKNGLERTDSSEHLTPCWEFPFPVRPRSSSDWHEECVQYPCVQFATRGNIQNVTQRDISGVPPSGQRLHKRSHVLPPLVDPPVPIKHCFPDLSPTKRSLPLPHTVSKGINMDPCSDTAFRQQKDWMKTKEEERENDRVEILKAVEKEVERKWKKLQRNSPGRGFLEQEEMVDMMKAMEAKRVKERVEILQLAEKEFERKWLEMQNAGQKPKGDKSEVHFAEKELENNLKGQMKNIPKPLEEIKRDKAEKDLTLSEIFDEELQRAKERIKILDKLMRDNKMERKLRLEEEKKKEKERKENKIQEKLKLEEEKRKEREQFKVLEKEIKSKGLEEKRRFKEEKERIENLQKEKKVRLKQEKLRLEAEKRKEKEMAKTLKKEKKEKEIKEKVRLEEAKRKEKEITKALEKKKTRQANEEKCRLEQEKKKKMVMMKNLKKDKEKAKKMLAEAEKLREREEKKCLQKEKERKKAEKRLAKAEAKNNAKAVEELQMQEEENRKHQLNTKGTAEMKKEQERTDNDKPKRILLTENIILVRQANRMDRHKTPSLKESDSEEWADTDGDDESETDW